MTESDPTPDDPESDPLEQAILGEQPVFNAMQVASETGVTVDQARRLWRALGFPETGNAVAFTRADLEAVSTLVGAVDHGLFDFDWPQPAIESLSTLIIDTAQALRATPPGSILKQRFRRTPRTQAAAPTPRSAGRQARDLSCRTLKLTMNGATMSHASGSDALAANAAATNRRCWAM